jgi:hypothetical protein
MVSYKLKAFERTVMTQISGPKKMGVTRRLQNITQSVQGQEDGLDPWNSQERRVSGQVSGS